MVQLLQNLQIADQENGSNKIYQMTGDLTDWPIYGRSQKAGGSIPSDLRYT